MAKIVITIEDMEDGGVFVSSDPPIGSLRALADTPETCTGAHGYAFCALTAIKRESQPHDAPQLRSFH